MPITSTPLTFFKDVKIETLCKNKTKTEILELDEKEPVISFTNTYERQLAPIASGGIERRRSDAIEMPLETVEDVLSKSAPILLQGSEAPSRVEKGSYDSDRDTPDSDDKEDKKLRLEPDIPPFKRRASYVTSNDTNNDKEALRRKRSGKKLKKRYSASRENKEVKGATTTPPRRRKEEATSVGAPQEHALSTPVAHQLPPKTPSPHKYRSLSHTVENTEVSSKSRSDSTPLRTPRSIAEMMGDLSNVSISLVSPNAPFQSPRNSPNPNMASSDPMLFSRSAQNDQLNDGAVKLPDPETTGDSQLSNSQPNPKSPRSLADKIGSSEPVSKLSKSAESPTSSSSTVSKSISTPKPRTIADMMGGSVPPLSIEATGHRSPRPRTVADMMGDQEASSQTSASIVKPSPRPTKPRTVADMMGLLLDPSSHLQPSNPATTRSASTPLKPRPLGDMPPDHTPSASVPTTPSIIKSSSIKPRSVADMMGDYSPDWILSGNKNLRQRKQEAVKFLLEYNDLDEEIPLVAFTPRYKNRLDEKTGKEGDKPDREKPKEDKEGEGKETQKKDQEKEKADEEHLDKQLEFLQNWHKYSSTTSKDKTVSGDGNNETDTPTSTQSMTSSHNPSLSGSTAKPAVPTPVLICTAPASPPKVSPAPVFTTKPSGIKISTPRSGHKPPKKLSNIPPQEKTGNEDKEHPKPEPTSTADTPNPKKVQNLQTLISEDEDSKQYQGLGKLLGVHKNELEFVENKVNAWEKLKTLSEKEKVASPGEDEKAEREKEYEGLGELLGVHKNDLEFVENKVHAFEQLKSLNEKDKEKEKDKENEDLSQVLGVAPDAFGKYLEEIMLTSTSTLVF